MRNELKIALENRTLSSFGISIGTGIMLESLFEPTFDRYDESREIPNKINVDKYNIHYYNIFTLARNVLSAISSTRIKIDTLLNNNLLMQTVVDEINTIYELYDGRKCEPVLFIPDYTKLYREMNINKDGSVINNDYMVREYILKHLKQGIQSINMSLSVNNKHILKRNAGKVMITTHIPVDLLNVVHNKNLFLLESHTGKLKGYTEFYTKLHKIGKLNLEVFPFIEEIVFILGDKAVSLPMKLAIRRELHKVAIESGWSSYTSKLVVMKHIMKNDILRSVISEYKKNY